MLIFIDTEFTDFDRPRLISIGMAVENLGGEFYAEVHDDFWRRHASDFVRSEVVPLLNMYGELPHEIADRIRTWAATLPEMGQIACDSDYDWDLLRRLMLDNGGWPEQFEDKPLRIEWTPDFGELLELYFLRYGLTRHHALHDARALRFAHAECGRLEAEAKARTALKPL